MSTTQYAPQYFHPIRKAWVYRSRKPVLWSNHRLTAQKQARKWKKHGRLTRIVTREVGPF